MKNLSLIVKATLIAGTLDILAAFLNFYIHTGKNPAIVLTYIASAIFGKSAMKGNSEMIIYGLLFHFIIAFLFTLFFSFVYPKLRALLKKTTLIAIFYGIFIWLVMNFIVVPNSLASKIPFTLAGASLSCAILIICIGFPLSYLFSKNKWAN